MTTCMIPLTDAERLEFERMEKRISAGLAMFAAVGDALREIRDRRLYREHYDNFESYCQDRWEFTRERARQLIAAATVASNLVAAGHEPPANERQARPLAGLAPEAQAEAWEKANEATDGQPTAADVAAVAPPELKSLPAEEQLAAIRGEEEAIEEEHAGLERRRARDADLKRLASVRHHLRNALRHLQPVTMVDVSGLVKAFAKDMVRLELLETEAKELDG